MRHPMYAGAVLLLVGIPLWLVSYAAAILAIFPIAMLAIRILVEEQFLRKKWWATRNTRRESDTD